ncbi:MAG TPA: alpha/beta fold hydrolase [Gemmatimonadaceae bacterium]|nr:alpha/beta fold hydrolase [Gemmatimonadaceae bacterium]
MRGEFVDIDGARLYYYAAGSRGAGEPVVFIHGFPTSSHLWRDVVPLVPEGHRVVVVDLLGYGRSDRPLGRDLSIRGHAERIIGLLDALRISYASIVGHDLGGGIAQYLAVRHPTRVARLALLDSVAFDDWPTRQVKLARATLPLTRHLPAGWILSIVRAELERGYVAEEQGAHSIDLYLRPFSTPEGRDVLVQHLEALDAEETAALQPRLKDIVAPTTVITGAHDPFLASAVAKRLQEAIPNATLEIVPDVRHFTPEEAPETIAAALTRWLER